MKNSDFSFGKVSPMCLKIVDATITYLAFGHLISYARYFLI